MDAVAEPRHPPARRAGFGDRLSRSLWKRHSLGPCTREAVRDHLHARRGQTLVAVPALELDVALVHLNRADRHGNATYLGPDPYFDDLFCMAAERAYVSCEEIVDTAGLTVDAPVQRLLISRMMVEGVVETPNGAHFTTCTPDYERDERFQRAYAAAAGGTDEEWAAFEERFLSGDEAAYQAAVVALRQQQSAEESR